MHPKKISVSAPSNIALIKYWGKVGGQYPMNASLSFTLKKCMTQMNCTYTIREDKKINLKEFKFEDKNNEKFKDNLFVKIERAFNKKNYPFGVDLEINTTNTFPHSSGIASSASSMAALAKIFGIIFDINDISWQSNLAREFSGSAARSVEKGWSLFGKTSHLEKSHQSYACKINELIHEEYFSMQDWIFVCSQGEKIISSSRGHELMEQHSHREYRCIEAQTNMGKMLELLKNEPSLEFFDLIEKEALALHALMMTSNPPYILITPQTLNLMIKITALRQKGLLCGYTLDAGATLHLLFLKKDLPQIQALHLDGYFGNKTQDYFDLIQDECSL